MATRGVQVSLGYVVLPVWVRSIADLRLYIPETSSPTSPTAMCHCGVSPNTVEIYSPGQSVLLFSQIQNTWRHRKGKCDLCWKILGADRHQEGREEGGWMRGREGGKGPQSPSQCC